MTDIFVFIFVVFYIFTITGQFGLAMIGEQVVCPCLNPNLSSQYNIPIVSYHSLPKRNCHTYHCHNCLYARGYDTEYKEMDFDPNEPDTTKLNELVQRINAAAKPARIRYNGTKLKLDGLARIILCGVYEDGNIWSKLRGMRYIVESICDCVAGFNRQYLDETCKAFRSYIYSGGNILPPPLKDPIGININMMPFYMSDTWDQTKLPKYLNRYSKWINACYVNDPDQEGKICYLTIQESFVKKGETQRRPGLHVESPGPMYEHRNQLDDIDPMKGFIFSDNECNGFKWGDNKSKRGIYMATNIQNAYVVWDCMVVTKMIGDLGDIEYLRKSLPKDNYGDMRNLLGRHTLYWMTKKTPYEALPMIEDGWVIFFRVVTHQLSFWNEQYCTPNPNGVVPDPKITKIIKKSKFDC